jgi:serine/threonine protein kinase
VVGSVLGVGCLAFVLRRFARARAAGEGLPTTHKGVQQPTAAYVDNDTSVAGSGWQTHLISEHELALGTLLGTGSFAQVFSARWRGTSVAVKRFEPSGLQYAGARGTHSSMAPGTGVGGGVETGTLHVGSWWLDNDGESLDARLARELSLLSSLRHPHIVAVYGVVRRPGMIVMELATGGSLAALLRHADLHALPWSKRREILMGVASGVEFLHACTPPVIHLDLKSANIVLSEAPAWNPKVTDFGLSMFKQNRETRKSDDRTAEAAPGGTVKYMAPEVARGDNIVNWEAIDAWGFGATFQRPRDSHRRVLTFPGVRALFPGCIASDCALLTRGHRQGDNAAIAALVAASVTSAPSVTAPSQSLSSTHGHTAAWGGDPPLPSVGPPPGIHNPDVPPPLTALVVACMTQNPDDRLSMREARVRLEQEDTVWIPSSSGSNSTDESNNSATGLLPASTPSE